MVDVNKYIRASFDLNVVERANVKDWLENHHRLTGHFAGTPIHIFYPTGIGVAISVRCPRCNEEKDVSDYACW